MLEGFLVVFGVGWSVNFEKKVLNTCVIAKFFVPLQRNP